MVKQKELNTEQGLRIRKAINYIVYIENLSSQKEVAELINRDKSNLSKAIKGDTSYTNTYIDAICDKYDQFSKEWFFTGKGEMLKQKYISFTYYDSFVEGSIPFYSDLPVSAGQQDLAQIQSNETPSGWIKPSEVLSAIGAFPVVGCSMEPFIHQGDFVTVAPVDNWDRVDPDKVYMIITVSDRMIKHLSQDEENDEIIWGISPNYPRVKIYKSEIKAIFRITFHGKML